MKPKTLIRILSIIIAGTAISACSQLDQIVADEKPLALPYINKDGKFGIISTETDRSLFLCDQKSTKSAKHSRACKGPKQEDLTDLVKGNSAEKYLSVIKPGSNIKIKGERTITIIRFVGSDCVTIYDWFRGRFEEICSHR